MRYLSQVSFAPFALQIRGKPEPLKADFRQLVDERAIYVFVYQAAVRAFIIYHISGPDVHIEALAILNKYRRAGVGRQLLDAADRAGLKAGCRRAIFYTNAQKFENIAYFRAKGFTEVERRMENGYERVYLERYLK